MQKNILIISASPRRGSNSDALADSLMRGALEAGHNVEKIRLAEKSIAFCKGCLACLKLGKCVIGDDAVSITERMQQADVLVFAGPVYYYSIPGQLKTMLDRANPLYRLDYSFRKVCFLTSAAEDEASTPIGAETAVRGWVDCFEKAEFAGTVFAGGVAAPGDIEGHKALREAYEMGKTI